MFGGEDVWTQVFEMEEVAKTIEMFEEDLARECVLKICRAENEVIKLEAIRTL